MSDSGEQTVPFDMDVDPDTTCAVCRTILAENIERMTLNWADHDHAYRVTICHPCLAEHLPGLLAEIERGV